MKQYTRHSFTHLMISDSSNIRFGGILFTMWHGKFGYTEYRNPYYKVYTEEEEEEDYGGSLVYVDL